MVVVLVACADKHDEKHEDQHAGEPKAGNEHAKHGDDLVHIDPEMLRDLRITTATAETRAAGERVTVLGELAVNQDVYAEVGTPIAARVVRIDVAPGDAVRAGQTVAVLESAELGKMRADVGAAVARSDLARKTLDRKRALAADRIVPAKELQEAEAEAAAAEAALRSARAAATTLGGSGSSILLRSPVAGTVIERNAVQGQLSDPARPLLRIGDLSRLWLTAHAFERDALRLSTGAVATVTFPALPGKRFTATVANIGREVDSRSRTIPVRLDIANPEGVLRPGMSATAEIPLGDAQGEVIAVPVVAVQRIAEGWAVFLPRDEGVFEVRQIGRGRDLGGFVEVLSGLEARETVVVDGAFLLKAEAEKSRGEGEGHEH